MPRKIRCSYCGAEFEVPETVTIAVCPYCGATVWAATGQEFREHYMFRLNVTANKAFDAVREIAQRQFEAPDDLADAVSPKGFFLHFIPLHLYHVKVRAECPGNPEAGLEEEFVSLLATRRPPEGFPEGYRFPVRGRVFFKPSVLERGRYYQPDVDPKELLQEAASRARLRAYREALNECEEPKLYDESKWVGIVHYPVWEVTYTYGNDEYRGLVDGTDASVIYLEYPIGAKERGILLALGFGGLLASILLGAAVGAAIGSAAAGAGGGFLAGLPVLGVSLSKGAAPRGRYVLKTRVAKRR